jgi:predicted transcriptional regulator
MVSDWYHQIMALTVRTDEQLEEALTALAEAEGISRQEIIRRAVLERYERAGHGERVERSSHKMIERWGDVLERLGTE